MTSDQLKERLNEDITEVLGNFIELKQNGRRFTACCPFHGEKTPSFHVTPERGMWKCFGCGKGGDTISFIMQHENCDFKEAMTIGAKKLNISFEWKKEYENNTEGKHREALHIVLQKAQDYFQEAKTKNLVFTNYITNRGFDLTDDEIGIGYAPDGNKFLEWARQQSMKTELLIEAGLIAENDNRLYDYFRDRVMFPICSKSGKVIGFIGRTLKTDKKTPKYLNSPESVVFTKGNELFGLNIARNEIRRLDKAYLVEGNFDVKRMHSIGVINTVAPCGTALTKEQANLLKQYTNKVTLIYDGNAAGRNAIQKNAEILIKEQFHVSVITLPDGEDPDSLFREAAIFEKYADKQEDYIIYKAIASATKLKNPAYKSEVIKDIAFLISCYDDPSKHEVYMEAVSTVVKPKKAIQDALKSFTDTKPATEAKSEIPSNVSLEEFNKWRFYTYNSCYYFADSKGKPKQGSNFLMKPLFHIESTVDAKRLYEILNVNGDRRVVEIPQKDLVSLSAFQVRVESLGNFIWMGSQADLTCLKSWLYEKTDTATEVKQMGWHKDGFYVWGNGIFNGEFKQPDTYGIVEHGKKKYYLPSSSVIYKTEENLFEFERKFINIEGNISLREYAKKFITVFGDNGKIALCFYFAALFRDIVIRRFDKYPIMNLFGPKGAGKNACAEMLLLFFGKKQKMPNLHNTSKPALADHVSTSCNSLCGFDEYRNDLEMEKREFLKGLWDGTGRTRMNMDKDKKKETTSVDQAVIVCGQQMATADIALFSRFIVISFTQTEYSDEEQAAFDDLHEIAKRGLTHITNNLLKLRQHVAENYGRRTDELQDIMNEYLKGRTIETRVLNNWMSIMAVYACLRDQIDLPFDFHETVRIAVDKMVTQNGETKKNDDVGQFWKKFEMLAMSKMLFNEGDYKIRYTDKVTQRYNENKQWKERTIVFPDGPKKVLYLTTSRLYSLYKRISNQEGEKPLPESTVDYYLTNSKSFICETKKEGFRRIDPKTGIQENNEKGEKMRTSTTSLVFDYELLNISIEAESEIDIDYVPDPVYNSETPRTPPF